MLKQATIALTLAMLQFPGGCEIGDKYEPKGPLGDMTRQRFEGEKREFLKIEELQIGTGPLAAWGRRITAHIQVRYTDGTPVFEGSTYALIGFEHSPEGGLYDARLLSSAQPGIKLGLNGMAVGRKRRITVDRRRVCTDIKEDAPPRGHLPFGWPRQSESGRFHQERDSDCGNHSH